MLRYALRLFVLVCFMQSTASAQEVRVLNLDFGNAGQFVGEGVLSSPGGTFWNEVPISGSLFNEQLLPASPLLDEFGESFGIGMPPGAFAPLPEVTSFNGTLAPATKAGAAGPRDDGVIFDAEGFGGIVIRELDTAVPFDLVIYFNEPSSIVVNGDTEASTAATSSAFPGTPGRDFLLFEGLNAIPTTIGSPLLAGVDITVPDATQPATIAAIQIRGVFTFVPEPTTATMLVVVAGVIGAPRRRS